MEKRDYYEVLGVPKGSSKQEIKSAYRRLVKEYHPDRNKAADAEGKFKEVQEAYEVLSDERKKAAYDQYGHAGTQGFGGGGFDPSGFSGGGFDMGDFGSINDIFEQFFGGNFGGFSQRGAARPQQSRGEDLEFNLKVKFMDAVFGTEETIRYKRRVNCKSCKGTGAKNGSSVQKCSQCGGAGQVRQVQSTILGNFQSIVTCPACHGTGTIVKEPCPDCSGHGTINTTEDFKITIPKGIPDGVTLRFKEKGNAGNKGGAYGDLYINVEVQEHETLEKRGDDIYIDLEIDASEAVLGSEKEILTVHGKDILKVPAGTQPEAVIRLSGKGAPRFKGNGNGDQYIKIIIKIPKRLTKSQKALWEKLDQIKDEKPGFFQ
jgi:molecular chaperone DnaJ